MLLSIRKNNFFPGFVPILFTGITFSKKDTDREIYCKKEKTATLWSAYQLKTAYSVDPCVSPFHGEKELWSEVFGWLSQFVKVTNHYAITKKTAVIFECMSSTSVRLINVLE